MTPNPTPGSIILDMLRSARSRQRSVRSLIDAGRLFGYSENVVRVNLSRLMARGLIETPQRGLYRLAHRTDAINDFVERWRLGETRVRPWQAGAWVFAHTATPAPESVWALDALGFRCVREGLFARPDNLALDSTDLQTWAVRLGLTADVLFIRGEPTGSAAAAWFESWRPARLNERYVGGLRRIRASAARLARLPADDARVESFTLGGEMIHLLAKDPLLPENQVDVHARGALTDAMLAYDKLGKEIWANGKHGGLQRMPHPQLALAR